MIIVSLAQMRQSNERGSVKNDDIFNLHLILVWALRSESPASGKTPATFIDSIHLNNHQGRNKESRNKI